jgi:hypothetical protein
VDQVQLLINLPYETLASLAAGYLSYRLAYTGKDASHAPVDVVFLTAVFAALAKLVALICADPLEGLAFGSLLSPIVGMGVALCGAAAWRRWSGRIEWLLRRMGISTFDRHKTAWGSFLAEERKRVTSLVVQKKNGETVMSEPLSDFENALFGPCIFGEDGSIAIYITHFRRNQDELWQETDPRDADWGAAVTLIPASEIAWVRVRGER